MTAVHNGVTTQHNVLRAIRNDLTRKQRIDNKAQQIEIVTQCTDNKLQCIYNALTMICNLFSRHNMFALTFLTPGFCKQGHILILIVIMLCIDYQVLKGQILRECLKKAWFWKRNAELCFQCWLKLKVIEKSWITLSACTQFTLPVVRWNKAIQSCFCLSFALFLFFSYFVLACTLVFCILWNKTKS